MSDQIFRQEFLRGYLDALDAWGRPSVDYGGDLDRQAAWQAGWDHFQKLVKDEQVRLEQAAGVSLEAEPPVTISGGCDGDGGQALTAEAFSNLLYHKVASDDAFDAIQGASRTTATEFVVHPFDGPPLAVKVHFVPG